MKTTNRNCEGVSRRDCLQLGLGSVLAGGLAGALRASEPNKHLPKQADACILVWLDGGPSHYETFDPKPEAPVEIRGQFSPVSYTHLTLPTIYSV